MKIPQRQQQSCGSSYLSARNYSKGPNKEDEGEKEEPGNRYFTFFLLSLQGPASCNGLKNKGAALRSKGVKLHSGVTPLGHLCLFGDPG